MTRDKGQPEPGKVYRLTGGSDTNSIAAGNTWAESEVKACAICGDFTHSVDFCPEKPHLQAKRKIT